MKVVLCIAAMLLSAPLFTAELILPNPDRCGVFFVDCAALQRSLGNWPDTATFKLKDKNGKELPFAFYPRVADYGWKSTGLYVVKPDGHRLDVKKSGDPKSARYLRMGYLVIPSGLPDTEQVHLTFSTGKTEPKTVSNPELKPWWINVFPEPEELEKGIASGKYHIHSGQWKSSRDENGDLFFEQTGQGGILMVRMDPSERCARRRFFFTAKLKRLRSEKGKNEFFQFHVNYRNLYNNRKASAFHRGILWPVWFEFLTEGHTGDPGCRKGKLSSGEDGKSPQARLYMNFQGQAGNFYFQMPPDYSKNYKLVLESDVLISGDTASLSYQAVNATEEYFRDCKFQLMVNGKKYFVQGATLLRDKNFALEWELSDSAGKKVLSGKNISFKVKDISPGKYKLKTMLTRNDGLCVKSTVFPVEILKGKKHVF
ncbi:MAG: hypothetical protein E7055_18465 [Lentisphaerae bacterium]|nr:hypothetical protein [Lentisphaerota bacterium]